MAMNIVFNNLSIRIYVPGKSYIVISLNGYLGPVVCNGANNTLWPVM